MPGAIEHLVLIPARFFRLSLRLSSLVSFGVALLGAMGIDLLIGRWRYAGRVASVGVLASLLTTGGQSLWSTQMGVILDSPSDTLIYAEVGRTAREQGPGPLLELPVSVAGSNLQADHMIGSIWHGQPIITGRTGYDPPRSQETKRLALALPDEAALRSLISETGLRWILVRPRRGMGPRVYEKLNRGLATSPLVQKRFAIGTNWALFQLRELPAT